jgi:CcmD family protein
MTPAGNWTFVGVAYAAVWIAIGGYWLYVHRELKRSRARYQKATGHNDGAAK